jgi:hypothetical protein
MFLRLCWPTKPSSPPHVAQATSSTLRAVGTTDIDIAHKFSLVCMAASVPGRCSDNFSEFKLWMWLDIPNYPFISTNKRELHCVAMRSSSFSFHFLRCRRLPFVVVCMRLSPQHITAPVFRHGVGCFPGLLLWPSDPMPCGRGGSYGLERSHFEAPCLLCG